jgi:hypothetical protein
MKSPAKLIERAILRAKRRLSPPKQEDVSRLSHLLQNVPEYRPEIDAWNREVTSLTRALITSRIEAEDLASIFAGLASYRMTGVTSDQTQSSLVNAYCNSSGLFHEMMHRILFQTPNDRIAGKPPVSEHFGNVDEKTVKAILAELDETGYCVLPFKLPMATVEAIRAQSRPMAYALRERLNESVPKSVSGIDPANPPSCVAAYAENKAVLANPLLGSLMNDPLIRYLASSHMRSDAQSIDSTLWYSFPSKSPSSESAQLFHFDLDTLQWLKVFYYLTDVTADSGPHTYVKGTHKPGVKDPRLLGKGYARITDEEMEASHPGKRVTITGAAGTIILGDTRCFHKGTHLKSGNRLIFSPIYAPSKIGYFHGAVKPG